MNNRKIARIVALLAVLAFGAASCEIFDPWDPGDGGGNGGGGNGGGRDTIIWDDPSDSNWNGGGGNGGGTRDSNITHDGGNNQGTFIRGEGTVVWVPLEGGFWGIEATNGHEYEPLNLPKDMMVNGLKVAFTGEVMNMPSMYQWGEVLNVGTITKL